MLGWLFYRGAVRINLAKFFTWTGGMLVVVAAGVLAYGFHDLQEAEFLPGLHQRAFDISVEQLPADSWYGTLLKGIFNFQPDPTVLQVTVWALYLIPTLALFLAPGRVAPNRATPAVSPSAPVAPKEPEPHDTQVAVPGARNTDVGSGGAGDTERVHDGARRKVKLPAVTEAEGAKALQRFAEGFNKANSRLDPSVNPSYESGALLAIDQAGIKAAHAVRPQGNPNFTPLTFKDAHFTVPKQAGWPKYFVADAVSNRKNSRWYLVFSRDGIDAKWRAVYLATFAGNAAPQFKTDKDGYAEAVPAIPRPVWRWRPAS